MALVTFIHDFYGVNTLAVRDCREVRKRTKKFTTPEGIDKLATRMFTLVDTDALDCMTDCNL